MEGTLYAVYNAQISKKTTNSSLKLFIKINKTLCMLILNVTDNGLASDFGVSRGLIMTYHQLCKNLFYLKMGCTNRVLFLVYSIY